MSINTDFENNMEYAYNLELDWGIETNDQEQPIAYH